MGEIIIEIKKLVEKECANHVSKGPLDTQHFCWWKQTGYKGICTFFLDDNPRCVYFEKMVLPLNPELEEEINGTKDGTANLGPGNEQSPENIKATSKGVSVRRVSIR